MKNPENFIEYKEVYEISKSLKLRRFKNFSSITKLKDKIENIKVECDYDVINLGIKGRNENIVVNIKIEFKVECENIDDGIDFVADSIKDYDDKFREIVDLCD